MGLADEAAREVRNDARLICGMAKLANRTNLTLEELEEAFDRGLTTSSIHRALIARYGDLVPGDQVVRRHRTGVCACGPR